MAWYNSAVHAVGNVVGPAAVGIGTVQDYLTPGKGSGTLTDAGHAITSGTSTFNNPSAINPFARGSVFSVAPTPAASPTGQKPMYDGSVSGGGGTNTDGTYNSGQYWDPGTGTYSSTPPVDYALLDQAIGQYEGQLGRLPDQLGIAQGNIQRQYGVSSNELQSGYDQGQNTYKQNTTQNQGQYVTNKNMINDTASSGLRGLLRTLGAYGAGGGSDAAYGRNIVATDAARQRSGAGETFGQNQQALDTSFGNFGIEHDNSKRKLEDWRTGQLNGAEQQSLSSKQSILQTLAQLRTQRAGGNTSGASAALAEAGGLQGRIDQLGAINPTYDGKAPVYTAPDAASYAVNPNATTQVAQNAQDSMTNPYLNMLLGKKKQSLQPAF